MYSNFIDVIIKHKQPRETPWSDLKGSPVLTHANALYENQGRRVFPKYR